MGITGDFCTDLIDHVFHYGAAGDVPVVGNWNGDSVDDPAVYSPQQSAMRVSKAG